MQVDQAFPFIARDGTQLVFYRTSQPLPSPGDIAKINTKYKTKLGVSIRNSRFTNEYNCHGLTFVGKLGWFDDVPSILRCHGYRMIGECVNLDVDEVDLSEEIVRGDIVVYYDQDPAIPTHTGIVWGRRKTRGKLFATILSKWGGHSEYFHRHDKVPANYGKSIQIWTDRDS